jgi:hypothetical protein
LNVIGWSLGCAAAGGAACGSGCAVATGCDTGAGAASGAGAGATGGAASGVTGAGDGSLVAGAGAWVGCSWAKMDTGIPADDARVAATNSVLVRRM